MVDKQKLVVKPNGDTHIEWVHVPFSEFIIDHVLSKKDRDRYAKTGTRKIYCG